MIRALRKRSTPNPPGSASLYRDETLVWLRSDNRRRPLAEMYAGAIWMLENREPAGWPRLVAHAVREICNRLPDAVLGDSVEHGRYDDLVEPLVDRWLSERPVALLDGDSPGAEAGDGQVQVSRYLAHHLDALKERREAVGEFALTRATRLFADLHGADAREHDVGMAARAWRSTGDWAVGLCHNQTKVDAEVDPGTVLEKFGTFERTLGAAVGPIGPMIKDVNAILDETNRRTG